MTYVPGLRRWGTGPRRAVMVHCTLATGGAFAPLARQLADAMTLTAFDLPGHGAAPWDRARDLMDQTVDTARAVAQAAGTPVDLIGHSFGAVACLRLALESPALVRSLILHEPVLFAAAAPPDDPLVAHPEFAGAWHAGDRTAATRAFLSRWGDGLDAVPPDRRAALIALIEVVPASAPALYHDAGGILAPGRLEALDRPVLLTLGSASPPAVAAIAAALAARLPRATVATIPGAGHMAPLTHAADLAALVRARSSLRAPPSQVLHPG